MAFCSECGKELNQGEVFCPNCGKRVEQAYASQQNNQYSQPQNMNTSNQDIPSIGLNILSFFVPLVGLILYVVNVDSKPVMAKAIGKWALIGFIVGIVGSVLLSIIYGVAVASFMFL